MDTRITVILLCTMALLNTDSAESVMCFRELSCTGRSWETTTARDCCLLAGLSYNDISYCYMCNVVGFTQTEMEVLESEDSYHVQVAVLKGLVNFAYFHTTAVPGSADSSDYKLFSPSLLVVLPYFPRRYPFSAVMDEVAQEGMEEFTLSLSVLYPQNVFVQDTVRVHIRDTTRVAVGITEIDYATREGSTNNVITATISYNSALQYGIRLRFRPLTYENFLAEGHELRCDFPHIATHAKSIDFRSDEISVYLPPTTSHSGGRVDVPIPIVDDNINEGQESFVGYIELEDAVNQDTIIFRVTTTQLVINDNDGITIGFVSPTYTFNEDREGVAVEVWKEDSKRSDQNLSFTVMIHSAAHSSAKVGEDFSFNATTVTLEPSQQQKAVQLTILDDVIPEETESFSLSLHFLTFSVNSQQQTTDVFIVDNDGAVIGFEKESYTVYENLFVEVCAELKSGSMDKSVKVSLHPFNELHINPSVFIITEDILSLNQGSARVCTIVLINGRPLLDETSTITLVLTTNDTSIAIAPGMAVIQILDNDVILKNCTMHLSDDGELSSLEEEHSFGLQLSCTPQIVGVNISIMSYLVSIYTIEDHNKTLISNHVFPANISDHSLVAVTLSVGDPYPKPKYIVILRSLFERNGTIYKGQRTKVSMEIDRAHFQLQFGAIDNCITWTDQKSDFIESILQSEIQKVILRNCSICDQYANSLIRRGTFICQSHPAVVTYRSTFINPVILGVSNTNASSLVSYLQHWVDSAPVVRLDWLLVNVNKDCPVAIDHLSDPDCVSDFVFDTSAN